MRVDRLATGPFMSLIRHAGVNGPFGPRCAFLQRVCVYRPEFVNPGSKAQPIGATPAVSFRWAWPSPAAGRFAAAVSRHAIADKVLKAWIT